MDSSMWSIRDISVDRDHSKSSKTRVGRLKTRSSKSLNRSALCYSANFSTSRWSLCSLDPTTANASDNGNTLVRLTKFLSLQCDLGCHLSS